MDGRQQGVERGSVTSRTGASRGTAVAMVVAGPLWVLYGLLAMLHPWGDDVAYDEALGYSLVRDTALFVTYSLPGALALVLSAAGTGAVVRHVAGRPTAGRTLARRLAAAAAVLGAVSLAGVVARLDPAFTAGRIFGTLVLGAAVLVTAWVARRAGAATAWPLGLSVVGALGVLLLPVWPLVYAVRWVPEAAGATVIGLFGLGWVWLGRRLWQEAA